MKKVIRLTESDLHRIVENSVNKMLMEGLGTRFNNAINGFKNGSFDNQKVERGLTNSRQEIISIVQKDINHALINLEGSYGNNTNIPRGIAYLKKALSDLKRIPV